MKKFTADFETSTPEWLEYDNKARVWAYSLFEIGGNDFIYGNNIDDFFKFCMSKRDNYILYFHNLKFDGEYIFNWLFENGYKCIKDKKERADKTFSTLISDMGMFYSIEIYFETKNKKHINKVTIYDSLKILNFSVEKIAKDFNLNLRKLNLDYRRYREVGYELKDYEVSYIRNDVEIMAKALEILFKENLTKMTIGSNALANYKETLPSFFTTFPILPINIHKDLKQSYRGGFTYLSPKFENKTVDNLIVLDVNSLYPSVMLNEYLPYDLPVYYDGLYTEDKLNPLYIQCLSCRFEIKENMIPTIQIKNSILFASNEYLESSNNEIMTLYLTSIDLDLFLNHYNVKDLEYHYGWKFSQRKGMFTEYINYWTERKIQAKKDNNGAIYTTSKLMLNSLYGKFASSCEVRGKFPYYEDNIVKYDFYEVEEKKPIYIPMACFITSYARKKTIETSQKIRDYTMQKYNEDYYVYSDTDSIHMKELPEEELKQFIDIDDYIIGYWKLESKARKGKFIRQKCYIEEDYEGNLNTTIAGLPKALGKYITFDNFEKGFSILASDSEKQHKLQYSHVSGGVLLTDTDFTIK